MRFALAVSLFLAACGGAPKSAAAPEPPAQAPEAAPMTEPTPTESSKGAPDEEAPVGGAPVVPAATNTGIAPGSTPPAEKKSTTRGAQKKDSRTGDPCAGGE